MNVKLLAYTPDPERTVACAAKLCYAAADIDTVYQGLTEEKTAGFLDMLGEIGPAGPAHPAPHRLLQRAEPALCEGEPV